MNADTAEPRFFLNSYHPLVATRLGRDAARTHGIPPFVDGSIRREPDLEHEMPGISCLCRCDKFTPRLCPGDTVGYMTVKARYGGVAMLHRRLTAVLRVSKVFASHREAAAWYSGHGVPLPNNCLVPGNPAKRLDQSHGRNAYGK